MAEALRYPSPEERMFLILKKYYPKATKQEVNSRVSQLLNMLAAPPMALANWLVGSETNRLLLSKCASNASIVRKDAVRLERLVILKKSYDQRKLPGKAREGLPA